MLWATAPPEFTYTQNDALTFEVHRPPSVDPKLTPDLGARKSLEARESS